MWGAKEQGESRPPAIPRYGLAFVAVALAFVLRLLFAPWVEADTPFLLFFTAVMVSAWLGGLGPGLLATALAAVIGTFYFLDPAPSFDLHKQGQALRLVLFVLEGALISLLGHALHRAEQRSTTSQRREQAAQAQTEAAQTRLSFLAEASAALASSLDYETTLQSVAHLAVPALADGCVVDILEEDGSIRRVAVAYHNPAKAQKAHALKREFPPPPDAARGVPQALRSGKPEFYPQVTDDILIAVSGDAEHLRILRALHIRSYMVVPLVARGRTLGAISFVTMEDDSERRYEETDLRFAEELARRAAVAVDNARLYREAQQEIAERTRADHVSRGQTAALTRTLSALTTKPALNTFLGQVLAAVTEQLKARQATLWFFDAERGSLQVHMVYEDGHVLSGAESGHPSIREPLRPEDTPLWQAMVQDRRPVVVEDVTDDPRVRGPRHSSSHEWLVARQVRTLLAAPLLRGAEVIGWLGIYSSERRHYEPAEIELAQALAQQAMLAVQLTRLAEQGQQNAILEERTRMAREIHDTLAQGLTGIALQLESAEETLAGEPETAQKHLARARDLARQSLAEARRSVWALRPSALEHGTLAEALAVQARQMRQETPVRPELYVHGTPRPLAPELESTLLRIAQEALTNILKHADASAVRIELSFELDQVCLSVQDNGRGFDRDAPGLPNGFGLKGMKERADAVNGTLTITSQPGQGTEIIVVAPTTQPAEVL